MLNPRLAERPRSKPVIMPGFSVGLCRIHRCQVTGDLANGLCMRHWDRGLERAYNKLRRAEKVLESK
jgi:hypothetical protein